MLTTDQTYATKVEAEHAVALIALHRVDGARQHDRVLPGAFIFIHLMAIFIAIVRDALFCMRQSLTSLRGCRCAVEAGSSG